LSKLNEGNAVAGAANKLTVPIDNTIRDSQRQVWGLFWGNPIKVQRHKGEETIVHLKIRGNKQDATGKVLDYHIINNYPTRSRMVSEFTAEYVN
jgi:hypothetical protein